jgi:hypothetical protein
LLVLGTKLQEIGALSTTYAEKYAAALMQTFAHTPFLREAATFSRGAWIFLRGAWIFLRGAAREMNADGEKMTNYGVSLSWVIRTM